MEDPKLTAILNALVARCALLECQILAIRRLLDKEKILADDVVEQMIAKVVQIQLDNLSKQSADERLAEFLRKYEGPLQ